MKRWFTFLFVATVLGIPANAQNTEVADSVVYDCIYPIQIKPVFRGSTTAFPDWIAKHLIYPEEALKQGIEGRVILQFDIDEEGQFGNVRVLRGVSPELDAEAIRVVESAPQEWTPGYWANTNNPTKVTFTCPVQFRLPVDFHEVEVKPGFNGGSINEFSRWVATNFEYRYTGCAHISGRIVTEFIVDISGNVTNIHLVKGLESSLDEEALRLLRESPKWEPGRVNGEAVPVRIQFPVILELRDVIPTLPDGVIEYYQADPKPTFNGKFPEEFNKWIALNFTYPEATKGRGYRGTIPIEFIINVEGELVNPVVNSGDEDLDNAMLEVLRSSPRWTPGRKDGEAVSVHYRMRLEVDPK